MAAALVCSFCPAQASADEMTSISDGAPGLGVAEVQPNVPLRFCCPMPQHIAPVKRRTASRISGWVLVSSWARESMAWAVNEGVLGGVSTNQGPRPQPQGIVGRPQVENMAVRLHRNVFAVRFEVFLELTLWFGYSSRS